MAHKRIDHVRMFVGNARQSAYFYRNALGFDAIASAGLETGVQDEASYVLRQGDTSRSLGQANLQTLRTRLMPLVQLVSLVRRRSTVIIAALAGFAAGAFSQFIPFAAQAFARADEHAGASSGPAVKAPIAAVMHCPLAFEGTHLLKEMPEVSQLAFHYCKPMNGDLVAQCLLYDGTGPDARLIGVEYLVSGEVYRKMPLDEQAYWHDHEYEVDAGLLKSLTQSGEEEKATLAKVRTLYGKIFHTWSSGKTYPRGPARLFWAVTGEEPFVLPGKPNG